MKGCFVILAALAALALADEKYTTKYDNVDLEQILQSDRLLRNYLNCVLDKGNCTPDGMELKKNLPDAIQTACSKCSEKQKAVSRKVIHFLIDKKRAMWEELEARFDPDGTYRQKYEAELKKEGIKV